MELPEENILQVQQELAVAINHLIQTDFAQLINILYRIDISERTLKETLQQEANEDAGLLIARLLIERQLQKQKVRAQFRSQENIPDDDKW